MNLGQLFQRYADPLEFMKKFAISHTVVGGIYIGNQTTPEMLITKDPTSGKLHIFENFSIPRRVQCGLPVQVFEIDESILEEKSFKLITK